jgi:hypothetical protein
LKRAKIKYSSENKQEKSRGKVVPVRAIEA